MNGTHPDIPPAGEDRLLDLLAARATEGLAPAEELELRSLLAEHAGSEDVFEAAAGAAMLAFAEGDMHREQMPADVRERLKALASGHAAGMRAAPARPVDAPPAPIPIDTARRAGMDRRDAARDGRGRAMWPWLAAAAAIGLAVAGWWPSITGGRSGRGGPTSVARTPAAELAEFSRRAPDAIRWAWQGKTAEYQGVGGQVVWSDALQTGFMLLKNLPVNNPASKQYQLWIVDPKRDQHPVDGGVFDLAAAPGQDTRTESGEVIVPIHAKLTVHEPAAFAFTLEQPGGVVVSAGPLLVVAAK